MMLRLHYLICLPVLMVCNIAFSQTSSSDTQAGLFTLLDMPTDSSACVDSPPFDDDFGWNGTCSCVLDQAVRGFGHTLDIKDGLAAVGSAESATGCVGSGSISVYESINGSWQLTADLSPANNTRDDQFPDRVSVGENIIMADNKPRLASDPKNLVIFSRSDNSVWQQTQQILLSRDRAQSFAHKGNKIVVRRDGALVTYLRQSDGTWQEMSSPLAVSDLQLFEISGDTLVALSFTRQVPITGRITIYEFIGNTWQEQSQFTVSVGNSKSSVSIEGDTIIYSPRSRRTETTVFSFSRNNSGNWFESTGVEIDPRSLVVGESVIQGGILTLDLRPTVSVAPSESTFLYMRDGLLNDHCCGDFFRSDVSPDIRLFSRANNQWTESDHIFFTPDLNISNQIGFSAAFDGSNVLLGTRDDNTVVLFGVDSGGTFARAQNAVDTQVTPEADGCDYSDADSFGGWGWNPQTLESCAPLENITDQQPTAAQCIDLDGDGYGWNGTETCTPDSTNPVVNNPGSVGNCDYSDADLYGGWGWNASAQQSCAPLNTITEPQSSGQCIDTDGDGYGWNGVATCDPAA